MNSDINVDMIKHYFFNETKNTNKSNNIHNKNHKNTKIKLYDMFIVNEVKISKKISTIPYYYNNYEIVCDYRTIEVGNKNDCVLENLDIVLNNENNDKYLLITYNSIKTQLLVDFNTFLFHLKTPKLFIFHVFDTYSYLSDSLHKLSTINVCFFDLCPENIVLGENYKPLLKNFQNSLLVINTLNDNYISLILRKIKNYTYKPLEIHLLYYLIVNDEITISFSLIDVICDNYMEGLTFLYLFNDNYRENCRKMCRECLTQYINQSKSEIMNKIFTFYKTWDSYSLSIMYIHIFSHMIHVFNLTDTVVNAIVNNLLNNIHPEPTKRETLSTTSNMMKEIYVKHADWSFINTLPNDKLTELYNVL
jgi:hypothetical protein